MDGKKINNLWRKWEKSADGTLCMDPDGIRLPPENRQYLENRIRMAFLAGADAVARIVAGVDAPAEQGGQGGE